MAGNGNKEALALELRQIIQADRMACDVLDEARDIGKSIGERAEKEKAAILADAEQARASMEQQVAAEQKAALQNRIAQLEQHYAAQKTAMEDTFAQNRAKWMRDILERITG